MLHKCLLFTILFLFAGIDFSFAQGQKVIQPNIDSKYYSASLSFSKDAKLAVAVQFPHQSVYLYSLENPPRHITTIQGFIAPRSVVFSARNANNFYITDSVKGAIFELVVNDSIATIIRKIPMEQGILGMVLDPKKNRLYVTNPKEGTLSVVDLYTGNIIEKIKGFAGIEQTITLNSAGSILYVGSTAENKIKILETETFTTIHTIENVQAMNAIVLNESGARIYVTSSLNNMLFVYSSATYKLLATIPTGGAPKGVVLSANNNAVITANMDSSTLSVIGTLHMNVLRTIRLPRSITGAIIASKNQKTFDLVYVLDKDMNILEVNWPMGLVQLVIK